VSVQQEIINSTPKKTSLFTKIKIGIAVIVVFFLVIAATVGILYLTNERAKSFIDMRVKSHNAQKVLEEKAKISGDTRISELAKYYSLMSVEDAGNKMLDIKKTDKKAYESIMSSMTVINPDKTSKIREFINIAQSNSDIIKTEYEEMKKQNSAQSDELAKYYDSLGIKGAIDAIKAAGKTCGPEGNITVISFDAVKAAFDAMIAGDLNASIECSPLHGPRVAEIIQKLEKGETVDKIQYVDESYFDTSMDLEKIKAGRAY